MHGVSLIKQDERFVFKWDKDGHAGIIAAIASMAREGTIDWHDAATLCKHIGSTLPKDPQCPK